MPTPYESIVYPNNTDFLQETTDGNAPTNLILARYVNKVQNILRAVEEHTQYSATTHVASGPLVYIQTLVHTLPADLSDPGLKLTRTMVVDATISSQHFGGNPFGRSNAIFLSAIGYKISAGVRVYSQVRAAVNIRQELGNNTCELNAVKVDKWRKGNTCEYTLMIVRL